MHTKTILVNGHKAVPIPEAVLAQCPLGESVDVSVVPGGVLVKPANRPARAGWAEALAAISPSDLDRDVQELRAIRETPTQFDAKEWDW